MSISTLIAVIPLVYLAIVSVPLVVIDYKEHRLPNKLVLPFILIGLVSGIVASAVSGEWLRFLSSFSIALGVGILAMLANYYDYLGMGDVKLFFGSVLAVGWLSPMNDLLAVVISLVVGFAVVGVILITKKSRLDEVSIPLGLYTLLATLVLGTLAVLSA